MQRSSLLLADRCLHTRMRESGRERLRPDGLCDHSPSFEQFHISMSTNQGLSQGYDSGNQMTVEMFQALVLLHNAAAFTLSCMDQDDID